VFDALAVGSVELDAPPEAVAFASNWLNCPEDVAEAIVGKPPDPKLDNSELTPPTLATSGSL
jgi:hypothetical protein